MEPIEDVRGAPDAAAVAAAFGRMQAARPLVQCVTNYVAMSFAANALLAVGASPAMVHAAEEAEEFAALADALTVNIGTLSPPLVAGMEAAIRGAEAAARPWVLDPVAVGATTYRTGIARDLLRRRPNVVRGNASEILALAGAGASGKGVDAGDSVEAAEAAARALAAASGAVVAATGETDFVTDGSRALRIAGGDARMPQMTATGCALTAVVGACLVAEDDPLVGTAAALAAFAQAGARAGTEARGPGSLQPAFLDSLAALDAEAIAQARIHPA